MTKNEHIYYHAKTAQKRLLISLIIMLLVGFILLTKYVPLASYVKDIIIFITLIFLPMDAHLMYIDIFVDSNENLFDYRYVHAAYYVYIIFALIGAIIHNPVFIFIALMIEFELIIVEIQKATVLTHKYYVDIPYNKLKIMHYKCAL